MSPWMILAAILAIGFVVLLFAPRLHRRSMQRSRQAMETRRRQRVDELRRAATSVEIAVADAGEGARLRDAMLLRGLRLELVDDGDGSFVVADAADADQVRAVRDDLRR